MGERGRVMLALRGKLGEQQVSLCRIARGDHEREPRIGQCGDDGPCRAACPQDARHAEIMPAGQGFAQGLEEARRIGVAADQCLALAIDRVHRTDAPRDIVDPVEMRQDRLLVRHGDVATAPVGVGTPRGDICLEFGWRDAMGAILRIDTQFPQPEIVDGGRFRLGDRIADHLGVGPAHAGSSSSARSAPRTGSSGMPRTVKWSPSIRSNSCTPIASIRNTPTHWPTSGHSAAR